MLEPLTWGRNTYTIVRLPPGLVEAATRWPTRRIGGSIDETPVNLGVNKADTDVLADPFFYVGPALQRRLQVGLGDLVECDLAPVDPDLVPLPDDVATALEEADRTSAWERRRPSERRQLLMPVENAVREATRATRIAALVRGLGD